jgi:hypothetical protein
MRDSTSRGTRPDGHSLHRAVAVNTSEGEVWDPLLHHKLLDARGTCHERGRFWSQQGMRESDCKIGTHETAGHTTG